MINVKKTGTAVFLVIATVLMSLFTACSADAPDGNDGEVEFVDSSVNSSADRKTTKLRIVKTAIIQYDSSAILEETCSAATAVFDDNNIEYDLLVGDDSNPTESCIEYANNIVIHGGYDSIMIIGSKAADDVYSEVRTASKLPIVFAAPDEPILKSFAQRVKDSQDKCYGVSVNQNIAYAEFDMINSFQPSITYLGTIYLESDTRSQRYLGALEKKCTDNWVVLNKQKAKDISEFVYMVEGLAYQTEAIAILPENSLEKETDRISQKAVSEEIPLYGAGSREYANRFVASVCYDYKQIGEDSAELMRKLMFKEDMSDIKIITMVQPKVYGNMELIKKYKIEIPEDYKDIFEEVQ